MRWTIHFPELPQVALHLGTVPFIIRWIVEPGRSPCIGPGTQTALTPGGILARLTWTRTRMIKSVDFAQPS